MQEIIQSAHLEESSEDEADSVEVVSQAKSKGNINHLVLR